MAKLKALLIDLSGNLHIGNKAIPGAVEALNRLRDAKLPVRFCSNTSKESRSSLIKKLRAMDFKIEDDEVFTSLTAARDLVTSRSLNPLYLLSSSAVSDFPSSSPPYDSVVVGLAPESFNYDKLNEAFRILVKHTDEKAKEAKGKGKGAPLIATHVANYIRADDGELSLGPGAFVKGLEEAADVKAEVVGKPTASFFRTTLKSMEKNGISEKEWKDVGLVGDDVVQDLGGGAQDLGLRRFLVKTGKYRDGDEKKADGLEGTFKDFAALVDWVLKE